MVLKGASWPNGTLLDIPLDENQNHVADGWEKDMGVWDQNLPASWDGADDPSGQAFKRDGISLYEKYRGFEVLNGVGKDVYERLDPRRKHVFVRNPDRLVRETFDSPEGRPDSYTAAAECEVRYLGAYKWSGPGLFKDWKRVVNFNCSEDKHAVDQRALHVILVTSPTPALPKDYTDLRVSFGWPAEDPLSAGTEGCAYPDPSAPAMTHEMGHGTGVPHHEPTSDSPSIDALKNCTMRYYSPDEFGPNVGDRFELEARDNNPDSFCHRIHNCWGQIRITDNLNAAAGAEAGLTAGRYHLEVTWEGRGLAPDAASPPGGVVSLATIPFEVLPATTEARQALHQRHLAWERFVSDDPAGAVACVREADRLDPANTDPIAQQSRFEVVEPGGGASDHRYLRVRWLR